MAWGYSMASLHFWFLFDVGNFRRILSVSELWIGRKGGHKFSIDGLACLGMYTDASIPFDG